MALSPIPSSVRPAAPPAAKPVDHTSKAEELANSVGIQLVGGDAPAVLSIWANTSSFPKVLNPALPAINVVNAVTGYLGTAADLQLNHQTDKNPNATKMDKVVNWAHFAVGDIVNTGASMVPLFTDMAKNPVMFDVFAGGQAIGILADAAKACYDMARNGQQAAEDPKEIRQQVIDKVEQRTSGLAQASGLMALQSTVFPGGAMALGPILAPILMTIGGSFGATSALNQTHKANNLTQDLEAMKASGQTTVTLPTSPGAAPKEISVDAALSQATAMKRWGIAQGTSSALMIAAGIPGLQFLAVPALVVAAGVGIAATADAVYKDRDQLEQLGTKMVGGVERGVQKLEGGVENLLGMHRSDAAPAS